MTGYDSPEDQRPLTYLNGFPIYVTTLLVILYVLTMIAVSFSTPLGYTAFIQQLPFTTPEILHAGKLWQFLTYPFVNGPSVWFVIDMFLLYQFGREIEQYLGRKKFLQLYSTLLLVPPFIFTLLAFFTSPYGLVSCNVLHFGVFVAFATLYPTVSVFFGVAARWVAGILFAIYTLAHIHSQDYFSLLNLWISAPTAALFIAYERGWIQLPNLQFWRRQPKFHVLPDLPDDEEDALESINPLLEKISRSGLASLTSKERAELERAREALMKKETRR